MTRDRLQPLEAIGLLLFIVGLVAGADGQEAACVILVGIGLLMMAYT